MRGSGLAGSIAILIDMISGRRRSVIFFTVLGICLVALAVTLNVSWVVLNWRRGVLAVLGVIFFLLIIAGLVLNTIFLVREIRRNEQHDSFINAVTHELKTPVASIRLYLRPCRRASSTRTSGASSTASCWRTATGCCTPSTRCCAPAAPARGCGGRSARTRVNLAETDRASRVALARTRFRLTPRRWPTTSRLGGRRGRGHGDADELKAAVWNLIDNAVKYSPAETCASGCVLEETPKTAARGAGDRPRRRHLAGRAEADLPPLLPHSDRRRRSARKGSGLGLFIVRSVARRHGGRAFAESEGTGRGSTFTLLLPQGRRA